MIDLDHKQYISIQIKIDADLPLIIKQMTHKHYRKKIFFLLSILSIKLGPKFISCAHVLF